MKMINIVKVSATLMSMLIFGANAQAQGTMFVVDDKVGIGTDSPSELLHLKIDSGTELKMRLEQAATNAWAYSVVNSNPSRPDAFRISKQGSGGPEVDIIGRNDPGGLATMVVSGSIQATNVTFSSSRDLKTDFQAVDPGEVLDRVNQLEMASWSYKQGSPGKHIGPIAEDFEEIFDLGTDGKTISVVDANGIALAAIQGLYSEIEKRDQAIQNLAGQIATLQEQVESMSGR